MCKSRSAFRYRMDLPARIHLAGVPDGLDARSLNLSRTGMAVRFDLPYAPGGETAPDTPSPRPGERIRVALYDELEGNLLARQWTGQVRHAKVGCGGGRIGMAFEWPEGRGARSRSEVESASWKAQDRPTVDRGSPLIFRQILSPLTLALTLAGFGTDQASKIWATTAAGFWPDGWYELATGIVAVAPARNLGALGSLADGFDFTGPACAATCLALMGLAAYRRRSPRDRGLRSRNVGLGLLAAGMLGNSADRLLLGHVRDFLVLSALPNLTFNLADVLILTGAASLLASRELRSR